MPQQKAEFRLNGALCLAWNAGYQGADRANGYWCPGGPTPGVAYVWLLGKDKSVLSLDAPISLSITAGKSITFPKLWFDTAVGASGGPASDGNRAYLVRLYDSRFLLRMSAVNRQFNVRRPAPDTSSTSGTDIHEFYFDSLSGVEPHDWNSAAEALWSNLPASLVGAYPGLPFSPNAAPQNIRYQGKCAWDALHDLLQQLDCTTAYDPIADKFSIIKQSGPQPGFLAAQGLYPLPIETAAPLTSIATRLSETIRVHFHRQAQHFGTEPDTVADGNWTDEGALFWLNFFGGGTVPGTVVELFDDMAAIVNFQGEIINQSELSARGQARAASWSAAQVSNATRLYTTYQGIAPEFSPGSQVSSVWWRDVGDGVLTEVQHYPEPIAPPWERASAIESGEPHRGENFQPPDFARHTFPLYPRNLQLIQVANNVKDEQTGLMIGEVVAADPGGNFSPDASLTTREPCLIADAEPAAAGQESPPKTRRINQYLFGRLNGTAEKDGQQLPLYVADRPPPLKHGTLLEILNPGGQADVQTADGEVIRGNDWWSQQPVDEGQQVFLRWEEVQNSWWIITQPQPSDESIITTWPDPPFPPDTDPEPINWTSDSAIAVALTDILGYGSGSAQLVRGNPVFAGARVNPLNVAGPPFTVRNFQHPVMAGELVYITALNPKRLTTSLRFFVTGSEYSGHFLSKNAGPWSKGAFKQMNVYGGPQGGEFHPQQGLAGVDLQADVFNRFGDIPDGKWVWVESNPWGWYVTSAEC